MADTKTKTNQQSNSIITRSLSWVDDRGKVDRFFWGLVVVGGILASLDLFYTKKTYFDTEHFPGFYALYGFFMCAALVVAAKAMRFLLMRDETYYAPLDVESEDHPEADLDRKDANV